MQYEYQWGLAKRRTGLGVIGSPVKTVQARPMAKIGKALCSNHRTPFCSVTSPEPQN